MRDDNPAWPLRIRVANDYFEDGVALRDYRYKLKQLGLKDAERKAYLAKEDAARKAAEIYPPLIEIWRDRKYAGMVLVRNRISGKSLHIPERVAITFKDVLWRPDRKPAPYVREVKRD